MSAPEKVEVRFLVNTEEVERAAARNREQFDIFDRQIDLAMAGIEASKAVQRTLRWKIILGIAASAMWLGAGIAMFCMKFVN